MGPFSVILAIGAQLANASSLANGPGSAMWTAIGKSLLHSDVRIGMGVVSRL